MIWLNISEFCEKHILENASAASDVFSCESHVYLFSQLILTLSRGSMITQDEII